MTTYEKRPEQVQAIKWDGSESATGEIERWLEQFNLGVAVRYISVPKGLTPKYLELRSNDVATKVPPHYWLVFHPYAGSTRDSLEVLYDSDFKRTYAEVEEPVDNDDS